jgi:succinyl-CoA synthetase alpha subunit
LVIGIGGDALPGTDIIDALEIFAQDAATKGIIIVGELGGDAEVRAFHWITRYHRDYTHPK